MLGRRVAVTGIGVVAPAGIGKDAFWNGLLSPAPNGFRQIEDWDPATVYRNLVKLREAGIAPVVSRAEGIDRYAYAEAPDDGHHHPHFYCEDCGRLACLPAEVSISLPVDNPWAASVRAAMVQLHGACPDCRG